MTKKGQHAIVLGASMAGLLTARVLSDHFERVTLLERDRLPDDGSSRKGVPQGRHAHAVLASGLAAMEQLFPGLTAGLVAGGAMPGDIGRDVRWYQFGGYKLRADVGLPGVILTRPFLEAHIRQRVLRLLNVTAIQEADVQGLHTSDDHQRILGAVLRRRGGQPEQLLADLTVDATGRGAQSPKWLEALGYARPAETMVKVNVGYATRVYQRQPGETKDALAYMIASTPPRGKRYGVLFAVEGQRWIVTLIGFLGDHTPADEAGFLEFSRTLPTPDISERIQHARPLTEIVPHKFPSDLRRHYEKMAHFPQGYLVLGDAMCSFNPIYGQGMTVAALEARTLGQCLQAHLTGLPARFFKQVTPVIDIPWTLATGEDWRYPEVEGRRPRGAAFINRYVVQVHRAAMTDPVVLAAFFNVANLNRPPASLFHPKLMGRVFMANRRAQPLPPPPVSRMQQPIR
jgi:2-polyprenyl-6-methoxyphenol hydroxylase-like FAD-dependent oxidoreductase